VGFVFALAAAFMSLMLAAQPESPSAALPVIVMRAV
jgi:hypothetical protein